eukprot:753281-Hanusia_phi.AAC.4
MPFAHSPPGVVLGDEVDVDRLVVCGNSEVRAVRRVSQLLHPASPLVERKEDREEEGGLGYAFVFQDPHSSSPQPDCQVLKVSRMPVQLLAVLLQLELAQGSMARQVPEPAHPVASCCSEEGGVRMGRKGRAAGRGWSGVDFPQGVVHYLDPLGVFLVELKLVQNTAISSKGNLLPRPSSSHRRQTPQTAALGQGRAQEGVAIHMEGIVQLPVLQAPHFDHSVVSSAQETITVVQRGADSADGAVMGPDIRPQVPVPPYEEEAALRPADGDDAGRPIPPSLLLLQREIVHT